MNQSLLVVGALFVLVYGPLAVLAWRRPLLARFAVRESVRRRGQFALLVVGLMFGSASITASLVGSDSAAQSISGTYNRRLGAVDLTVTAPGGRTFPADVATRLASDHALMPYVSGVQAGVELPASVADLDQRLGRSGVLLVGFDPASQPAFGTYALMRGRNVHGDELAASDVLLSRDLAAALNAVAGDRVRIGLGGEGEAMDLQVYGVAAEAGPGAYGSPLAVYVPLATAQRLTGDSAINVVRIAARGGTPDELGPARRAAAPLRAAVARVPAGDHLAVNQMRLDAARSAEGSTAFELGLTLGFSAFTTVAAIALIVNLVLALAEERRPRLAILRALGLTRGGLIALSVLEGAIYSLAAATVGVAAGVPTGLYLARQLWETGTADPSERALAGVPLEATVRPGTLALAFAVGALITLGTVAAAAYRTSRMEIASAVRDLPGPATPVRDRWQRTAILLALALVGAAALVPDDVRTRLVGGIALILALAGLARGRLPDRVRATAAGLLAAGWAGIASAGWHYVSDLGSILLLILVGVTVSAVGLSVAAAANLGLVDAAVGLLGGRMGRLQAALRPSLAYLSRRPVRTGLTTSAFAVVMVMVTVIAIAVGSTDRNYPRDSAGYDIQVVTAGPDPIRLPPEVESQVQARIAIPMRLYQGAFDAPGYSQSSSTAAVTFYVLPETGEPVHLGSKEKRFSSDAQVWRAVREERGLVVGGWSSGGGAPGDAIKLEGVDRPVHLHLAGMPVSTVLDGLVASPATVAMIDTRPAGETLLVKTKPGSNPRALARQIERSLFAQGVDATSTREILDQDYASNLNYTTEFDVLLHMGLLVGVLALAMVGIRAAIERRKAIGVLRALGYGPRRVLAGLLVEAGLTTTIGVVTGIVAGIFSGYFVLAATLGGPFAFALDVPRVAAALAVVYVTVMIVTVPIASRVTRMSPVEAIRMTG